MRNAHDRRGSCWRPPSSRAAATSLDRMIATSDRTRERVRLHASASRRRIRDRCSSDTRAPPVLDETWVYGLIRQESRFIADARSSVGAQGLMQLMPATARYVARKRRHERLRAGARHRARRQPAAGHELPEVGARRPRRPAGAGHAPPTTRGPGRPRAWRAALPRAVEGAIFAETIPFNETRDYVKKVMSNTVYYAALFENKAQSLEGSPRHGGTEVPPARPSCPDRRERIARPPARRRIALTDVRDPYARLTVDRRSDH
ncbi:MAG: transglycosylase SLT domain-containing protein [Comamonadaceae bacterium]|nr:transglycosylase SLT domain-containing protein [Comamonadaceae bacterium]